MWLLLGTQRGEYRTASTQFNGVEGFWSRQRGLRASKHGRHVVRRHPDRRVPLTRRRGVDEAGPFPRFRVAVEIAPAVFSWERFRRNCTSRPTTQTPGANSRSSRTYPATSASETWRSPTSGRYASLRTLPTESSLASTAMAFRSTRARVALDRKAGCIPTFLHYVYLLGCAPLDRHYRHCWRRASDNYTSRARRTKSEVTPATSRSASVKK